MNRFIFIVVQKAGQNMEHTLIAAYVAMLIGYLIIDNEVIFYFQRNLLSVYNRYSFLLYTSNMLQEYEKFVRNYLPEKNFHFMISVLQKFYSFMTLTASVCTIK